MTDEARDPTDSAGWPAVSVITPVFNGERYIDEVLRSVLKQRGPSFEYLVVDDGSTDNTGPTVQSYAKNDTRVRYLRQANSGEAGAVNTGIRNARGRYLIVVNADDPLLDDALHILAKTLDSRPDLMAVYPDWLMIDEDGHILQERLTNEFSLELLIGDFQCLPGPAAMFRRGRGDTPLFRDETLRFTSDYEYWVRMSLSGPLARVPRTLATWRYHHGNATTRSLGSDQSAELTNTLREFFGRHDLPREVARLRRQSRAMAYYYAAIQKMHDPKVPGRRLMVASLATPFMRVKGGPRVRRRILAVFAVFLSPLSTHVLALSRGDDWFGPSTKSITTGAAIADVDAHL